MVTSWIIPTCVIPCILEKTNVISFVPNLEITQFNNISIYIVQRTEMIKKNRKKRIIEAKGKIPYDHTRSRKGKHHVVIYEEKRKIPYGHICDGITNEYLICSLTQSSLVVKMTVSLWRTETPFSLKKKVVASLWNI